MPYLLSERLANSLKAFIIDVLSLRQFICAYLKGGLFMIIANNIIKHHLKDVYIVSGSACGGKSTVTKYLAKKYGMILYNWDEQFSKYQDITNSTYQPAMSQRKGIRSWEEYFMRPVEEYADWLKTSFQEQIFSAKCARAKIFCKPLTCKLSI